MQPRPPESYPPVSTGRAAPPPRSRIVAPLGVPALPEPPETPKRSVGRVLGTVATVLLVLAVLGVIFKIIVRPIPEQPGTPAAVASDDTSGPPVPAPATTAPAPVLPSGSAPVQASGVPMPLGDLPGWRQTFADDFTEPNLAAHWYLYNGQPGGDPGGYFNSGHITESNGILTIGAWRASSPAGNIYVSGGMSNAKSFSQAYGLYKVRFKMDKGWGISYTLQLWPSDDHWPPEIDILEDSGKNRTMTSATLHYGADNTMVHREVTGNWAGWHTAEVEWSKGQLIYRIDGKQWTTISDPNVPSSPMSIAIQSQAWSCGHTWEGCPNASTPSRVNLQIDWVVAYQKVAG